MSEEKVSFVDDDENLVILDDEEEVVKKEKSEPLTKDEKVIVDKAMNLEDKVNDKKDAELLNKKVSLVEILNNFKKRITDDKFEDKCIEAGKKYSVGGEVVKNKFIKHFLGTIADVLNLTISITGDIIIGAVRFINSIISSVVNFTAGTMHKLINLLTFNCGSI